MTRPEEVVQEVESAETCQGSTNAFQVGDRCPICCHGLLDYDGMLNLACPKCSTVINTGGAFT